jgi:hypothetical protein
MRFGAQNEDVATLLYMSAFPDATVTSVGVCATSAMPPGWNASPDALLDNAQVALPAFVRDQWPNANASLGVLEIKSSVLSLAMEAYYIPQVYWEMMSTDRVWTDVVRYRRTSVAANGSNEGGWRYRHEAHVYRVYRHRPTEEAMVTLVKEAAAAARKGGNAALQALVHTDRRFVDMRAHLTDVATALQPVAVVDASATPAVATAIEQLMDAKDRARHPEGAPPLQLHEQLESRVARLQQKIARYVAELASLAK